MRFSVASLLAFASAALAQTVGFDVVTKPTQNEAVPAGKTYTIEWDPSAQFKGTVTLTLLGGSTPKTLEVLSVIKSGVASSAGKFDWAVPATLGSLATYGIEITLDSDPTTLQFSFPFKITGGSAATGSTTGTATGTKTTETATGTTETATTATTANVTTTSTSSSSAAATTLTTLTSSSRTSNLTSTGTRAVTTSTHIATKTGSGSSSTPTTVPTNDAKSLGGAASMITLIGGLAVAFFAL